MGQAYSAQLAASGGTTPYTWSITSGQLGAGLSLNASTGAITGTPTAVWNSSITVQVKDSTSPTALTATVTFAGAIQPAPLTITTTSLGSGTVGQAYSAQLAASGGTTPYTWSITSGQLGAGLSLNASTGAITGTPTQTWSSSITVQVKDSTSPTALTATASLKGAIQPAPLTITTTSLGSGTVGQAYSAQLTASGGTTPYTWSITSGQLGAGLSLNATTGAITGTPTQTWSSSITVQVKDSTSPTALTATATFTGAISPAPLAITTTSLGSGTVGQAYSAQLAASGGTTPYTWSITSGQLGAGLSLNATTGAITGTPTQTWSSSITVQVKDSTSPTALTATASLKGAIQPAPLTITTTSLGSGTVGQAYSAQLTASGGTTPYTWSITSGQLGAGLSLNATTGAITGTPTQTWSSSITVQVKDSTSPTALTATATFTGAISPAPLAITTTSLGSGTVGQAYSAQLTASGGTTPYTWSITSGQLGAGLSLNATTGAITGTPTQTWSSSITVQVKDSTSPTALTATATFTGAISPAPLAITTTSLGSGTVGQAYSAQLAASGGTTPYTWSITSGQLGAGLSLNATTGAITGTPTQTWSSSITVQVKDSTSPTALTATATFTGAISPAPLAITTTSLGSGTVGQAYSAQLTASGGTTPYTWSITSGQLGAGLSLNATTGAITGTPTQTWSSSITVQVKDSTSPTARTATATFTGAIQPAPLAITTTSLASGSMGQAYSAPLAATGGTPPYTWSISSGQLPAGLSLNSATGAITGTPTKEESSSFTVEVEDSGSPVQTATAEENIGINCPTGQSCGTSAAYCQSYTPPSTSGATAITSLPYIIKKSGNYYLPSSLSTPSGAAVGISIQASNVDINLNGNTLTYGEGGSSATNAVGQYGIISCDTGGLTGYKLASVYGTNGYCTSPGIAKNNITIENGAITQSTQASGYDNFSTCPGASVGGNYSPNPCAPGGNDGDTYATTFSHDIGIFGYGNLTVTHVTFNFQQVSSDGLIHDWTTGGDSISCNTFNNGVVHVDNRAMIEGVSIWGGDNSDATGGDTIQYNTITGGPQGGILSTTTKSNISSNDISAGAGASGQIEYTNDFAIYAWGAAGVTVSNNYIHDQEGRGIEDFWNAGVQTTLTNSGNYISTVEYPNNYEYNVAGGDNPGCEMLGSTGTQYRGAGVNDTLSGLNISVSAGACPAAALQDYGWGSTTSSNSSYAAHAISGFEGGAGNFEYEATALWLDSGTSMPVGAFVSTNDTFVGDSSIMFVDWWGLATGQTITLISPTLTKGSNPVNFNTFRFWNGGGSVCSGCVHVRDATFKNGASATDADMTYLTESATGTTAEYFIDWTYNLTVTSGGNPVSGADVTIVDKLGNTAFTGTTNANGQIAAVLTQFRMHNTASQMVQENRTPDAVTISSSGCTTLNYIVTITGITSDARTLTCQ